MTRALLLLALLLAACGAPATETPAPVPTVPANWCRVTALSFVAFYATTDTGSARQGEVTPASDFHVRPASVQFAGNMIWGYAVSHWGGEYAEGWAVLYDTTWRVAATPANEACLFQVFAPSHCLPFWGSRAKRGVRSAAAATGAGGRRPGTCDCIP